MTDQNVVNLSDLQSAWDSSAAPGGSGQREELEPDTFAAILGDCSVGHGKKNPGELRTYIPFRALEGPNSGKGGLKTERIAAPGEAPEKVEQHLSYVKEDLRRLEIEAPDNADDIAAAVAQMSGLGVQITIKQNGEYTNTYINGLTAIDDLVDPTSFADTVAESKAVDDMTREELVAEFKVRGIKTPSKRKLEQLDDEALMDLLDPPPPATD